MDGEIGVVTELVLMCRCLCLSSVVVVVVAVEEEEWFRDFEVMLPLQSGQVCLILSHGSTQFLWNSCLWGKGISVRVLSHSTIHGWGIMY